MVVRGALASPILTAAGVSSQATFPSVPVRLGSPGRPPLLLPGVPWAPCAAFGNQATSEKWTGCSDKALAGIPSWGHISDVPGHGR